MKRTLLPVKKVGGVLRLPGDKSIAHRAVLFSLLAREPIRITNFPDNEDCRASLEAVQKFGVTVQHEDSAVVLTPPSEIAIAPDAVIDCKNSATTARLLAGIIAGSRLEATLTGDDSLRSRPMERIINPLSSMGAELFADEGHLPMRIKGNRLTPLGYELPVSSAQVKSSLLLAGIASHQKVTIRERVITRNHTEILVNELGSGLSVRDIKPVRVPDPNDPRKTRLEMPEKFKREITVTPETHITGGEVDLPGDISTAAFFLAAAAISGGSVTVENLGINPTRTAFLDHLKAIGCTVDITDKKVVSGEVRGTVTVTGGQLKARKISGETAIGLIDEIPIVAVMAAFAEGTTIVRNVGELRVKESDRLEAIVKNLQLMGVKCGLLEDGLVIDGGKELAGADFLSYGDHRIAMAFSIAALFLVGPSSMDDAEVVSVSCPSFYNLLEQITVPR